MALSRKSSSVGCSLFELGFGSVDADYCRACGRGDPSFDPNAKGAPVSATDVPNFGEFVRRANTFPELDLPEPGPGWTDEHRLVYYRRCIDVVGENRDLAWGTMIYACKGETRGNPGCGWEHRVWLGIGVEGPPTLREVSATVPSPFFCGRCPRCGLGLAHDRWREDEEFDAPRPFPDDVARFIVPTIEKAQQFIDTSYGGADYIDPTGQTIRR